MKFLRNNREIQTELKKCIRTAESFRWSVAWASVGFPLFDMLLENRHKIHQLSVGIHFYQTHPDFIASFMDHDAVRFVMNPSGVFHPKLYYFKFPDGRWKCITGSANFTHSAFSSNSEVACLFDSSDLDSSDAHLKVLSALDDAIPKSQGITPDELAAYREIWKRQQKRLEPLSGTYTSSNTKKSKLSPLDVLIFKESWADYMSHVKTEPHATTLERIEVLQAARNLFGSHDEFRSMSLMERKCVAGFGEVPGMDWLWFGSMKGAGFYKQAINRNNDEISAALDQIPFSGEINGEHYARYSSIFSKAFQKSGVATATRLLAMKRPDYFICLDSANRDKLCNAFGISKNVSLEDYWDKIIRRVLDSNWWNSPEPADEFEKHIWNGRAAFLDSRFYVPK